jgi:methyltransferase type 12
MKSIWDFWANYYNKLWVQKYSLKPSRDKVIDIIKKTKIKNGDLLDMGCGTGQLLEDIYIKSSVKILTSAVRTIPKI